MPTPSSIRFSCPHCSQHIECGAGWAGQTLQCPGCAQAIAVPGTGPEPLPRIVVPAAASVPADPPRHMPRAPIQPRPIESKYRDWANFSLATPIVLWVLLKTLGEAIPSSKGLLGLLVIALTPLALAAGFSGRKHLRTDRARGARRALAGVWLNSFVLVLVLIGFIRAIVR